MVFGAITVDGKVCIGNMSLRNYTTKYIKPKTNRNNITCGCKTCISAILLQLDLNGWRISQLDKLDKLYINYASTGLLKYPRMISLNKIIKHLQIIHIFI